MSDRAEDEVLTGGGSTSVHPERFGRLGGGPPFEGQQLLWAITWRTRGAAWMLRNRAALQRAIA